MRLLLITATICQSGVAMFLFLHGTLGQFLLVAILPTSVLIALVYLKLSGQTFFHYPKTLQPAKAEMGGVDPIWIRAWRLAYVHPLLQEEAQQHLSLTLDHTLEAAVSSSSSSSSPLRDGDATNDEADDDGAGLEDGYRLANAASSDDATIAPSSGDSSSTNTNA